jgi:tetratricopeptide (TPR) repeat protein
MGGTRRAGLLLAAAVSLAALAAHLPALRNGFVEWDDGIYVFDNPAIRSWNASFLRWAFLGFHAANWHPLTWLSHALDWSLWGSRPAGHHLTSVVLHALNAFLVVRLTARLLEPAGAAAGGDAGSAAARRETLVAAGCAGALFALHPISVETVAWVSERKSLLSACFSLASVLWYLRPARGAYAGAFVLFSLALLCKPMAVSLPLVLLILDWCPLGRVSSWRGLGRALLGKAPFLALAAASSLVTILAQRSGAALAGTDLIPLPARVANAAHSIVGYLGKLALPAGLVPYYPFPEGVSPAAPAYAVPIVLVAAATALLVLSARRRPAGLALWAAYLVMLLPVLGLVQVGRQAMADRYAYLPGIPVFMLAGVAAARLDRRVRRAGPGAGGAALLVSGLLVCSLLAALTVRQTAVWRTSLSLWDYVIERSTVRIPEMFASRGLALAEAGRQEEAIADFTRAIAAAPRLAAAYAGRGDANEALGRHEAALGDYRNALALDPGSFETLNNLGVLYARLGRLDLALEQLGLAAAANPRYPAVFLNRGILYARLGQGTRAAEDFRTACGLGSAEACRELAGAR